MTVPATGADLWLQLERSGAITPRSLHLPAGVSIERLYGIAAYTQEVSETGKFVLGDALVYCTNNYDDAETENLKEWLVEKKGASEYTLRNKESVCRSVRPNVRRDELSFSHHDTVRALEPSEQKRLLGLSVDNQWTRQRLRDEVYGEKVLPPAVSDDLPDIVRDTLSGAKQMMDGWLISRDSYQRLRAALGEQ